MSYRVAVAFLLGVLYSVAAFADPDLDCTKDPHHCDGGDGHGAPGPPGPPGIPGIPGPQGPPGSDGSGSGASATSESDSAAMASNQLDVLINQSLISIGGDALAGAGAGAQGTTVEGLRDVLSPRTEVNVITNNPDKIEIKNTPSMMAPDIFPTVSCFRPVVSGALSWAGFGASGGGGVIDEDCVKREYIRLAFAMGMMDRAAYMWCQQEPVWEDFGTIDKCLMFEVDTDAVDEALSNYVTEAELVVADAVILKKVEVVVAQVDVRVASIESRLDAGAAAARTAANNDRMWKSAMAERYLGE